MTDEDDQAQLDEELSQMRERLVAIESATTSFEESHQSMAASFNSVYANFMAMVMTLPMAVGTGFCVAWLIATLIAGEGVLPVWPVFVVGGLAVCLLPVVALRMNHNDWDRNVQTLRDNQLVIVISSVIGLGLFALGLVF